jgi:hypothetical protein
LSDDRRVAWPTVKNQPQTNTRGSSQQNAAHDLKRFKTQEGTMNSIIYIVGLVVIIGAVLSYFGFR